jgi:hypothetical protein
MKKSKKTHSKKITIKASSEPRPAKRKKIVSLAQYEAEAARERAAQGVAPAGDVGPQTASADPVEPTAKDRKPGAPRKSLVSAAVLVLAGASAPMNAKAIVEAATTSGWYMPGAGKTPHATLYSAMLRDAREAEARFRKADRGTWELTDAGKASADSIKEAFAAK